MRAEPQHVLSFCRVLLGAVVLFELSRAFSSYLVLPAVVAACAADYADGKVARARGTVSRWGRLIDNVCDAAFLGQAFAGFALASTWSLPLVGHATRYWAHANWLPLIALAASFGAYALRSTVCRWMRRAPAPSPRGHTAGVANYVLAVVGAVAVFPGIHVTPWLLEPTFITVALLNVSGAAENAVLLARMPLQ